MAEGKIYALREKVIDRMLHTERGASIKELFDACNEALADAGFREVQSENTILADLTNIDNRYSEYAKIKGEVLVESYRDPEDRRRMLYRYTNPDFSIYNVNLNQDVIDELQKAIDLLSRFQYLPVASWVSEMDIRLRNVVFNNSPKNAVIEFDQDPKYKGNRFVSALSDAIMGHQTVEIDYAPFGQKPQVLSLWPYYLKQYHHLWYLMATNAATNQLEYIQLNYIKDIRDSAVKYKPCSIDIKKYLSERIGVTNPDAAGKPIKMRFWASENVWPELLQVPLHHTQTVLGEADGGYIFAMETCLNQELMRALMQFGSELVVLEPLDMRLEVAQAYALSLNRYGFNVDFNAVNNVVPENKEIMDSRSQRISYIDRATGNKVPTLTVTVSPENFDAIRSGEITELHRDVRPINIEQYLQLDENGFELEDENGNAIPIHYEAILLQDGYDKNSRALMISVKDVSTVVLTDDNDKIITYRYLEQDWFAEQVIYTLGPILRDKVKPVKYSGK